MSVIVTVPPTVVELVQNGFIERAFYDGLFPKLMFRGEAKEEQWEGNTGTEILMTRRGPLPPVTKPLAPGTEPQPKQPNYEQWVARLAQYADTMDIDTPTSAVASQNLFQSNIHSLGLGAGHSIDRVARNNLFKAYLSGHTVTTATYGSGVTSIHVASLNGFQDVVVKGTNVRPRPVGTGSPLAVTISPASTPITRNVIEAIPDNADDPDGPGTLVLSAALGGAGYAARTPVISSAAPRVIRAGGGYSVDAIGTGDIFSLSDMIAAALWLRKNNVPTHEDGYYHAHLSTEATQQELSDPLIGQLVRGLPEHVFYKDAFVGLLGGAARFQNNEAPEDNNCGLQTATGTNAKYSEDIGAETVNEGGTRIGRIIVTGRGSIYERWLDERSFVTEAGISGKQGEFTVVNNGMEVMTERIRLVLRAPIDRLMRTVAASWSCTTSFPVPSDITFGTNERYKRAVVIEHALA